GMVEISRRHLDVADVEGAFDQVVITDGGAELVERDRKIRVLHLARERLAQGLAEALGAIDVPIGAGAEERSEERNALDMIPMGVTDQDMPALDIARDQFLAERVGACPAIDHDQRATRRAHLDAGSIAAIPGGGRPGRGYRAASTPELNAHAAPSNSMDAEFG